MMQPLQATLLAPGPSLPTLPLDGWANACLQALQAGDTLMALWGRPATPSSPTAQAAHAAQATQAGDWVLTAITQSDRTGLRAWRGHAPAGASYPSLTAHFAAAQMPERELHEQTGLKPLGHPWLKPVRFAGPQPQRMDDYPFFTVRGHEVHEVGVGPIHASVIEPGHFRFMCHGERVQHLEIQLGYQHRGVEALLLQRQPLALSSLVESIAGDTSIAYAWGYCAAVEALAGAQVPADVQLQRAVALELERVAMHLVALTGLATDIAFLQGGASYGRLRTAIINATQRVCGNRFGRGWLRPGGVRPVLHEALRADLVSTLAAFAKDLAEVNTLMRAARTVQSRFKGTGTVSRQAALDLGLVGLAARASGVAVDSRHSLPGALYTQHPLAVHTHEAGDCWARMVLRMDEIDESLRWLMQVLQAPWPGPDAPARIPLATLAPDTLCVTVQEGFRGPVVQALETGPLGELLHYKVQDPSLFNWFGLALSVRNNGISDFPLCNKSFDLSYCGNDL